MTESIILSKETLYVLVENSGFNSYNFLAPIRRWGRTVKDVRKGCASCPPRSRYGISDGQQDAIMASLQAAYSNEIPRLKQQLGVTEIILPYTSGQVRI